MSGFVRDTLLLKCRAGHVPCMARRSLVVEGEPRRSELWHQAPCVLVGLGLPRYSPAMDRTGPVGCRALWSVVHCPWRMAPVLYFVLQEATFRSVRGCAWVGVSVRGCASPSGAGGNDCMLRGLCSVSCVFVVLRLGLFQLKAPTKDERKSVFHKCTISRGCSRANFWLSSTVPCFPG